MRNIFLLLPILAVAGCASADPYRRTDVWYPSGANAGNLAAQAVRPHDLIQGRGSRGSDARLAADAIDRVWGDQTKALPAVSTAPSVAAPAPAPGGAGK